MGLTGSHLDHFSSAAAPNVGVKNNGEFVILREGPVKITNLRAMIGIKTYAIEHIRSVRMQAYEPKLFLPVFFMLVVSVCSALVALSNMNEYSQYMTIGLVIGIGGFLFLLLSTKTKYSVRVRSSVGELSIFESSEQGSVERIVSAIQEALYLRA
ncbi:MAG TPA: DUF6232 family protein [Anaerolineales bacterium]|nr:DUF6232 family protein [Anaerolineales bacterium]